MNLKMIIFFSVNYKNIAIFVLLAPCYMNGNPVFLCFHTYSIVHLIFMYHEVITWILNAVPCFSIC